MKKVATVALICAFFVAGTVAQKNPSPQGKQSTSSEKVTKTLPAPEEPMVTRPEQAPATPQPLTPSEAERAAAEARRVHWDMTEAAPVVTKHQITVNGKTLRYTATAGRLPIKDVSGNIDAEMFYVAYTLDGADPSRRPVTFSFNGGPGSASIWLHMGALGPRKVVLQPEGWLPPAPYRLEDNAYSPLDKTDLVLIDAIGTGFSRPADLERGKKFWGLKGDIEAFGEFIRLYITRNDRWSSPLFLLGESYGTTRAAGIAGYLADRGITFNGITLLSSIIDFQTVRTTPRNDEGYVLTLPSYTMVAAYHKRLAPELLQDFAKTRAEVERWASGEYTQALAQGDLLDPQQHQAVVEKLAYYTGLKKDVIEQANLRIDVPTFTMNLLADQKLKTGRLDGRYTGPDPDHTGPRPDYFDPTSANTAGPFTAVFNDYIRRELGYKTDLPYMLSARELVDSPEAFRWDWGNEQGFPDTASALRSAMAKNVFLKVQVMEGYFDLATPYYAANHVMNHLDLLPQYRKNISYATYDSGHMVYLEKKSHAKMQKDFEDFVESCLPKQ